MSSTTGIQQTTAKHRYMKPDAVKRLESALHRQTASKHPTIPAEYIPRPNHRDDTANGLTKCVIAYIGLMGGQAERINTTGRVIMQRQQQHLIGGRTIEKLSPKYIPTAGTRGSADISATIGGRSVKIEIKVGRDKQRADQVEYQHAIERAGGVYYIAHDFATFVDWYQQTFCCGWDSICD